MCIPKMRRDIANNLSIGGGGLTWRRWFYSEKRSPACEETRSSNQYFPSFLLHLFKTCCSSLSILLALSLPLTRGALDLLPTPWPKTSSLENLISAAPAENALRQHQGITSSQINWSINTRTPQWASCSTHPRYPNREKEDLLSFWLGFEVHLIAMLWLGSRRPRRLLSSSTTAVMASDLECRQYF